MKEPGHFSLLHYAAGNEGSKCLKFLLDKGEYPNQICNEFDRATPLHFAVLIRNEDNVKLLLRKNANPNAKDNVIPTIFQ
jgi:ankyrin repeat protein